MSVVFFLGFVNYDYFILVCTILSLQLFISSIFSIFLISCAFPDYFYGVYVCVKCMFFFSILFIV